MAEEEEALRSTRFTLMMDAHPGFPDRSGGTAGTPPTGRWRRLLRLLRR